LEGLEEEGWGFCYHLDDQLINIYKLEEEYWRQRGRVRWSFQGDANTTYFYVVANGRRRKCMISTLTVDAGPISDKRLIQDHIYSFYRELLGSESIRLCGIAQNAWDTSPRVSAAENLHLALTFSKEELEEVVKEIKTDTAPGLDGFPVAFFQRCWSLVKHGVLHILNDFILVRIDIARLNFGVLSLIPQVSGADKITQYMPIALINVIFKIVSKHFASKLDPIAHRVISQNQTAFIKGRFMLDGAMALQEIIHEMKSKKLGAFCLNLILERPTIESIEIS
jgi:hypothetical protein